MADVEIVGNRLVARSDGGCRWEVRQVSRAGFMAVRNSATMAEELADGGFLVANGTVLRVHRWSLARGMFPSPKELVVYLTLQGVPLVLCDEVGVASMVNRFATVGAGFLGFVAAGSLTTVQCMARVSNHASVPPVILFDLGGEPFLV